MDLARIFYYNTQEYEQRLAYTNRPEHIAFIITVLWSAYGFCITAEHHPTFADMQFSHTKNFFNQNK